MASPLAGFSIVVTVHRISGELLATIKAENSGPSLQLRLLLERSLPRDQALKLMISGGGLLNDCDRLGDHVIREGQLDLTALVSLVTLAELKRAGWSASDLKHRGYTFVELQSAGYSLMDLRDAGASIAQIWKYRLEPASKAAGFSV